MAQMFYAQDCNLEYLMGKKIAIVGYGSQGHAHALNLRDSGCDVVVALYEGSKSWKKAEAAGLTVMTTAEAAKVADMIMILINDEKQAAMYHKDIEPYLRPGMILAFAHGFNIHFGCIKPPKDIDVVMIAPKGPGHTVRSQYLEGKGVPDLVAVYQDASGKAQDYALAYAAGIGGARAGILKTTFREETETDLFGEQCVLCGGVTALMKAGFDTRYSISNTAEYGDYEIGQRLITEETKKEMKKVLTEIQDGTFARNWLLENQSGCVHFLAKRRIEAGSQLEEVGKDLRGKMSWGTKVEEL